MGLTADKVLTGNDLTYPIAFNVPALVPNIEVPNCIHTDYHLRLIVGFIRGSGKGAPIAIKVPILLGTHIRKSASNNQLPGPPPAYSDIGANQENIDYDIRPPTYTPSVGGLSSIESGEENANYTPLCYHYNFAFNPDDEALTMKKKTK
jgi:hypothetical protein